MARKRDSLRATHYRLEQDVAPVNCPRGVAWHGAPVRFVPEALVPPLVNSQLVMELEALLLPPPGLDSILAILRMRSGQLDVWETVKRNKIEGTHDGVERDLLCADLDRHLLDLPHHHTSISLSLLREENKERRERDDTVLAVAKRLVALVIFPIEADMSDRLESAVNMSVLAVNDTQACSAAQRTRGPEEEGRRGPRQAC